MPGSIFQHYLNQLTDLSSRNKSLYLPKTASNGVLDLQELDFLNGESAFVILSKAIGGKKKIPLIPETDPRLGEVNQLSKILSRIAFRDQLTQEETGDQSLVLAWPFVEGKLMNGKILRAPFLLLPCKLEKLAQVWTLIPLDTWQINSAFILAYSHGNKVALDSEILQNEVDELSNDPTEFRVGLVKLIEEKFAIQISSSLFEDRISLFPNSQISIDQDKFQDGKLALKSYALVGQFAQKGNFLFRDYEELMELEDFESLEKLVINHFHSDEKKTKPREDQVFPVFPLDASQENVLLKVREGNSLVVEGPPGTGKSQLIANLVSDYTARGKKVLVVSQKRAALDVVFERMAKEGFGAFLGLVHDYRADQKSLFEKLKNQIESIENYQEQNRGLDSMHLEREISQLSKTIIRLSEKFEQLRNALFEDDSAGIPVKAMYLQASAKYGSLADSKSELLELSFEQAADFEKEFKRFQSYQQRFKDSFWEDRLSFAKLETDQFFKISELLEVLENYSFASKSDLWDEDSLRYFQQAIIQGTYFSEKLTALQTSFSNLPSKTLAFHLATNQEERKKAIKLQDWIKATLPKLEAYNFSIPENLNILKDEFSELALQQTSWLGRISLGFKKSRFPNLLNWLDQNDRKFKVENLIEAKSTWEFFEKLAMELDEIPLPKNLSIDLSSLEQISSKIASSLDWVSDWNQIPKLDSLVDLGKLRTEGEFSDFLKECQLVFKEFELQVSSWKIYFTSSQILTLVFEGKKVNDSNQLQTFSELVAFDKFLESWDSNRLRLGQRISEVDATLSLEEQIKLFWNSWFLTWIFELERRNPILADAGSLKLKHEMEELKEAILEKRKISKFMTLLRLREGMSDSLEINRLGNRLTYRDLLHQVSKKRQKWPIRKLVEEFGDEIFRLIPCWLASPETVSALFPMEQAFDLVIFDEASQCPVERGLPAMLRGKQVVVAGDSKQLRPSDFYQVKWESDEEGIEFESESLLELAGNFFQKTVLKGHYRSADPGLIYFSNQNFYSNKLEMLPDLATVLEGKSPFTWLSVDGVWENQVNKSEADAVLEKVKEILSDSPSDSLGIVTGNYFQMELIRGKLWEAGIQGSDIKVRNIENVQGDEFDQVVLSLGYAPNRAGKLVTNFGLLGKSGAENRLNVAITRARKRMHVISSISSEDFRPSQLQNPGLTLLREFLDFAKRQAADPMMQVGQSANADYKIDWSLKSRLLKLDTRYSDQIPSAVMDLTKQTGNKGAMAILTDDQRFFNSPSAKAAMAYHPILLEAKGWQWEWCWSRDSLMNS